MELEEKLNELRSGHSHQIDDLLINQGQIRKVKIYTYFDCLIISDSSSHSVVLQLPVVIPFTELFQPIIIILVPHSIPLISSNSPSFPRV